MLNKARNLRFCGTYNKQEKASEDFVPTNASAEAQICLNCPLPKCKPDTCKRLKEERQKLKGQ